MCGICGIIGKKDVVSRLIDGLRLLEYRGYDSAGAAVLNDQAEIERRRASGKLVALEELLAKDPIKGNIGIAHTRWATHGKPTVANAHPHVAGDVAVVHNGIIENYAEIRDFLQGLGRKFTSETDTEVCAHLIDHHYQQVKNPIEAVRRARKELKGAYALGIIFAHHPDVLVATRFGAPLAVGYGEGENYIGSDSLALAPLTKTIAYLENGDLAILTREAVEIFDINDKEVKRPSTTLSEKQINASKGNYRYFMEKELHEHPDSIQHTFAAFDALREENVGKAIDLWLGLSPDVGQLIISGCGSAYYSGMVGKYWIEEFCKLWVEIDVASEMRYRHITLDKNLNQAALLISQSGETADTLGVLRRLKEANTPIMSILNAKHSSMARESDAALFMQAGPEISVASTKAFTAQLTLLALVAMTLGRERGTLDEKRYQSLVEGLKSVPSKALEVLSDFGPMKEIAKDLSKASNIIFLGRGILSPIAAEGALKLKEITYIHAQSYAAGELKHGPISLVDEKTPIIALAPSTILFDKMLSNLQEVHSRGGKIIAFTDAKGAELLKGTAYRTVIMPDIDPAFIPMLYVIPLQIMAFEVALERGTDVDQPRNLAKSVTVE